MHKQVIKQKTLQMWKLRPELPNHSRVKFTLNSPDAIETSYYPQRLEIRPQTPNNRSLF